MLRIIQKRDQRFLREVSDPTACAARQARIARARRLWVALYWIGLLSFFVQICVLIWFPHQNTLLFAWLFISILWVIGAGLQVAVHTLEDRALQLMLLRVADNESETV